MPYGVKWCSKCRKLKKLPEFMARRGSTEYHYCRDCMSHYQRQLRDSGRSTLIPLTCAICNVKFSNDVRPDWDHDHKTGEERNWLCRSCNLGIGYFNGDTSLFLQAIEYLRFHSEPNMTVFVDQKILSAYNVDNTTQCSCGGFKSVVHCPQCGSTQCYANKRASPQALLPGFNSPTQVRAFRCKLCSLLFSEVDTVNACKATTRWRQRAEQEQRIGKAVDKATPEATNAILEAARRHIAARQGGAVRPPIADVDNEAAKLFETPKIDEDV